MLVQEFMNEYSSVLQRADVGGTGITQDIVNILAAYKRALPIDFLAHVLKRSTADLEPDVELLKDRHVLYSDGENVGLVSDSKRVRTAAG